MTVVIKDWFASKLDIRNGFFLLTNVATVKKETEKAYLVIIDICSLDGEYELTDTVWVPKSCTMTEEEAAEENAKYQEAMKNGFEYNQKLVEFAKANGIKNIRNRMRTATLIQKITDAGLEVPARA